jgi:hypothetical protein
MQLDGLIHIDDGTYVAKKYDQLSNQSNMTSPQFVDKLGYSSSI